MDRASDPAVRIPVPVVAADSSLVGSLDSSMVEVLDCSLVVRKVAVAVDSLAAGMASLI